MPKTLCVGEELIYWLLFTNKLKVKQISLSLEIFSRQGENRDSYICIWPINCRQRRKE